jgi:hypothetical protein
LCEPIFLRNVSPPSSGQKNPRARNQLEQVAADCSHWFIARGFFCPEDGGDTFLRNVGSHKIYTRHIPKDGILSPKRTVFWYVTLYRLLPTITASFMLVIA